jgi:hypothetical protein
MVGLKVAGTSVKLRDGGKERLSYLGDGGRSQAF